MSQIKDILKSKISLQDESLNDAQTMACYSAMIEFAAIKVNEFRVEESKSVNLEAIKLFPALFVGDLKLWLRKRSFLKAKKQAQTRADIEGRPFYVIRMSEIKYSVQSTQQARLLKRKGFYNKNVTSQKLIETADCICYPSDKSVIGSGITTSEITQEMKSKKSKPIVIKRK